MSADRLSVPTGARASIRSLETPAVDLAARTALVTAADALLEGRWRVFAHERYDMAPSPDWHRDPRTDRTAPRATYCFAIDHRHEPAVGNVKYVWELSRHTHCTVLAAAYQLTGRERYATAVATHLRSWWDANPFLSGINWSSGIEIGLRLIAWVWIRRLLAAWPQVTALFEDDPRFLRQLHHHQDYLATFQSRGSSANNHLIAEAAGQFTAAAAFPIFAQSERWRRRAARTLHREIPRQVFPSGLHRELASEYHGFVLELALVAALEGEEQRCSLGPDVWRTLRRMTDALAATVDVRMRPPRQGDGDEGHGLLVDAPDYDRWSSLLATGAGLFGALPWWPTVDANDVRTALFAEMPRPVMPADDRATTRPPLFEDAGQVFLRAADQGPELWCRLDAGPHGYLGTSAHAHADALAVELREGGIEVLTDPGTYCYHGDAPWRAYFRSTFGHNTLELAGADQSITGGPFLWTSSTDGELLAVGGLEDGAMAWCTARHPGYHRLRPPATHYRRVVLHRTQRRVTINDWVECDGAHGCRLAFHLGPDIACDLRGSTAWLRWEVDGSVREAQMQLPATLTWSSVIGDWNPIAGWYALGFDRKVPAVTLVGSGRLAGDVDLVTRVAFSSGATPDDISASLGAVQPERRT